MQIIIDSHAHIQFPAYDADRDAVVLRAREVGVGMVNVGTQASTSRLAIDVAERYGEGLWATVGFHPSHLALDTHHDPWELEAKNQERFDPDVFAKIAAHSTVVAIGECGLDYYRIKDEDADVRSRQQETFIAQFDIAKAVAKPLIIHCRDAFPDLIALLGNRREKVAQGGNGVIHFFSGSWDEAKQLMDLGFFLGFGGVVTFPPRPAERSRGEAGAREYEDVLRNMPLDHMLVETDAPYVAPVPYRGKRNEPAYIVETVKKIAELKAVGVDEVAAATTANAKQLFGI